MECGKKELGGAMSTETQGEAAEIWGQAFGLPQSVVD